MLSKKKTVVLLALLFIAITAGSALLLRIRRPEHPHSGEVPYLTDGRLHLLIVGEDNNPGNGNVTGRSDALMVATYDPELKSLSLLSIPRDTLVEIPGRKYEDKINHALAFGGIELTMRTVSQFLNIPLRYYVHVQTDGFRRIVDAIGGVPIYVEKDMRYTDRAGGLYINLKQGEYTLDGEQAEGYVRYRLDSDLKRVERQQKFIAAALKEVLKPANILKVNQLFKIAFESIKTNIPISVGLSYLSIIESIKDGNVTNYTIEGDDTVWINDINYFVADREKLNDLIETYFYSGIDRQNNQQVTVRVLVGNGDIASGEKVVQMLREQGFRVLSLGSADTDDQRISQVVGTSKDVALNVAQVLVLHDILVDAKASDDADVIVIVGRDLLP